MHSRRVRGWWLLVAGAAAVLLLAGCAQESGPRAGGQGGATSVPSTAPPSSTAPGQPPRSSVGGVSMVVQGTVRQGVEPGCLLLDAQDKTSYLLLDGDPAKLRPGARVEVSGLRTDQIASFCGEGKVLSVVSVRPLR